MIYYPVIRWSIDPNSSTDDLMIQRSTCLVIQWSTDPNSSTDDLISNDPMIYFPVIQWSDGNDPVIQLFDHSYQTTRMIEPTNQWSDCPMIQWSTCPVIQWSIDPSSGTKFGIPLGAVKKRQTGYVKPYLVTSVAVMQGTHGLLGVRDY